MTRIRSGNLGIFTEGFSEGRPFKLSAADHKFFGTTKKSERKAEIERRIKGKNKK